MKAEEVYAKLKNLIELDEGIGKKTEIDDTNVSNKTTYSSEKIVKEIETLKSSQTLECEGENITCENTLASRTSDVVVKGQTYQNLILGKKSSTEIKYENGVITSEITPSTSMYPAILFNLLNAKANQKYTFLCNVIENKNNTSLYVGGTDDQHELMYQTELKIGINKIVFTSKNTLTDNIILPIWFHAPANIQQSIKIKDIILLEGDWTNKEVPNTYIDGIESAGEKENKISILSTGKNLVENKFILNRTLASDGTIAVDYYADRFTTEEYSIINIGDYIISCSRNFDGVYVVEYDCNKKIIVRTLIPQGNKFIINNTKTRYIRLCILGVADFENLTLQVEKGSVRTSFQPYQRDKKEILLPIEGGLKSLPNGVADTIEQRADGVYLVQRVKKETYVNGDENNNNYLTDKVNTYKPLETPAETKLNINNLNLEVYEDTTYITTDNAIQPVLSFRVPINIGGIIQENAQNINKLYNIYDDVIIPQLINNSADNINYQNSNYPLWTNVKKALDGIISKIDYIKPEITSFTSTAQAVYEVGQRVSNIVFNWTTNKNVTTQTLTDCTIDANSRTATYTNEISSNKTFTLTVGDGQNTASKSISIAFRNKIYYGSSVIPSNFNSAFILGLSKKQFATSKSGSFSITVGNNEYGFIAFPSSFGTLTSVKIGGFDTDVISCGNISFTNSSGGVATYSIYRTGRHSLGAITMVIS